MKKKITIIGADLGSGSRDASATVHDSGNP